VSGEKRPPASPRAPRPATECAPPGAIAQLLRDYASALARWALAAALAAAALWLSRNTPYRQLALGVLTALVSLFVALALVEIAWRILVDRRETTAPRPPRGGSAGSRSDPP